MGNSNITKNTHTYEPVPLSVPSDPSDLVEMRSVDKSTFAINTNTVFHGDLSTREGYILINGKKISEGLYDNKFKLLKGSSLSNRNNKNNWAHGTFENGLLEGKCKITSDYEGNNILLEGIFADGYIQTGKYYYKKRWYVGRFKNNRLSGDGAITEDYEGKQIYRKGTFVDDILVDGIGTINFPYLSKKFPETYWFSGTYTNNGNPITGKVSTDIAGEDVFMEGTFSTLDDQIYIDNGRVKNNGVWLQGSFKLAQLDEIKSLFSILSEESTNHENILNLDDIKDDKKTILRNGFDEIMEVPKGSELIDVGRICGKCTVILIKNKDTCHIIYDNFIYLTYDSTTFHVDHPVSYTDLVLMILLEDQVPFKLSAGAIDNYTKAVHELLTGNFKVHRNELLWFPNFMKHFRKIQKAILSGHLILGKSM